ncbi:hypothetical protein KKE38_04360 [Candidatus Micrarchaeota archaeon]|nr:hypothetical protein [Candidatus Micrarchaeota archaeon]
MAEQKQTVGKTKVDDKKNKAKRLGWKFGVGAGLATAAMVATLFFRSCGPQTEGPITTPPTNCPTAVTCPAEPAVGDNNCELTKGEHDVFSESWDPASCGFCGDGVRQPFETAENCPVDFTCGDGEVQHRAKVYGAIVQTGTGESATCSFGTKTIPAESCRSGSDNYCEADCRPRAGGNARGAGSGRPPSKTAGVATVDRPPRETPGGPCGAGVRSGAGDLISRVSSSISSSSGAIKSAAGVGSVPMNVIVSVRISSSGVPTLAGSSATCGGERCPNSINPAQVANLSVAGITVAGAESSCTLSIPVKLR